VKHENTSIRLKKIMQERSLRQVDILELTSPLCKKYDVKMNKSDISQYVSGKVEPSQDKLVILGMALNVNEAWLMGYDVPMNSNITPNEAWDAGAQQFEDKSNAFYYQLRGLGWHYQWSEEDEMYILSNGSISFKITNEEYSSYVNDLEAFCKDRLEELYKKSFIQLFPKKEGKNHLQPVAAHERTDIEVTDEMRAHDDAFFDDF
jgi:transcriptional regulator with XRE-family HTH domain